MLAYALDGGTPMLPALPVATFSAGGPGGGFGTAIGADGDAGVVGAPGVGRAFVVRGGGGGGGAVVGELLAPASMAAAGGSLFGGAVAICANATRAFVGAPGDDGGGGENSGTVCEFALMPGGGGGWWSAASCFRAFPAPSAGDRFGYSLALDCVEGVLVVGAPTSGAGGAVYGGAALVFNVSLRGSPSPIIRLSPRTASPGQLFGAAVAAASRKLLVGSPAYAAAGGGASVGAVYAYALVRDTGAPVERTSRVVCPDSYGDCVHSFFGGVIAASNSLAVAGAPLWRAQPTTPASLPVGLVAMLSSQSVWAAPWGSDAVGLGTRARPLRSITAAFGFACSTHAVGDRCENVILVAGFYQVTGAIDLTAYSVNLTVAPSASGDMHAQIDFACDPSPLVVAPPCGLTLSGGHLHRLNFTQSTRIASNAVAFVVHAVQPPLSTMSSVLYITDCNFNGLSTRVGALLVSGAAATLKRCSFWNNANIVGVGGAISGELGATIGVSDSTFVGNIASAENGGAIALSSSLFTAKNCEFVRNVAAVLGGAMFMDGDSSSTLLNATFTANSGERGGAIYATMSTLVVQHSCFTGNSATIEGGAMLVVQSPIVGSDSSVGTSLFVSNSAQYGGAVAVVTSGVMDLEASVFTGNSALVDGGGPCTCISAAARLRIVTLSPRLPAGRAGQLRAPMAAFSQSPRRASCGQLPSREEVCVCRRVSLGTSKNQFLFNLLRLGFFCAAGMHSSSLHHGRCVRRGHIHQQLPSHWRQFVDRRKHRRVQRWDRVRWRRRRVPGGDECVCVVQRGN